MNTKTHQNLQKGTKDLNSKTNSKQATGKLMDNILSNMKTHIKKPAHQAATAHVRPIHHHPTKLEPEYLNNILIDLNDANKLKTRQHKINNLVKTVTDKSLIDKTLAYKSLVPSSPSPPPLSSMRKAVSPPDVSSSKSPTRKPANLMNTVLSKTEKRPKSGIKRRLKKLIGYKDDDNEHRKTEPTSAHSGKQIKATKKSAGNVHTNKEDASHNVHHISNPEQSMINNTNSIAENKFKKNKKDTKKIDLKERKISYSAFMANDKIKVKSKPKPTTKKKNASNTSCPQQTVVAKTSVQSQQSKKIKLLVNQIASNLKQTSCFEINTGNIKRDIYIKGLSTCMTSQALDQINRILNPPRLATFRANLTTNKTTNNSMLSKSSNPPNVGSEETPRLAATPKTQSELSKMTIANEINTFNKPQQTIQSMSPPQSAVQHFISGTQPRIDQEGGDNKPKETPLAAAQKDKNILPEKVAPTDEKVSTSALSAMTPQEQELIKKINEKIDKIITSGLNEMDDIDTSSTSFCAEKELDETIARRKAELMKAPVLPPPSLAQINLRAAIAKAKEPAKFMQAPIAKQSNTITVTTTKVSINPPGLKTIHEPLSARTPPPTPPATPKINNILTVVRNSEAINSIKQNTIKALQNAAAATKSTPPSTQQSAFTDKSEKSDQTSKTDKSSNNINKMPEKKPTSANTNTNANAKPMHDHDPIIKTAPLLKQLQLSKDNLAKQMNNIGQRTPFKLPQMNIDKNAVRKPSRQIGPNSTTSTITTTHIYKNKLNITPTNGTSSSSTLNLIATLSTSKKFALLSPMEVVQDFVNLVNHAKRNRKTFTICGNFYSLRRAFAERGWIEKMRINIMEDRETWRKIESLSNFELVDGMRNKEYGEKYRRVFLTKLLAGHQVDFYWDYLTNPFAVNNDKIKRTLINRFPYGATRAYTSKHGLTESLRDAHWYCIEGQANIYYPRTYNLSMIEEISSFVEDFRITAVISLLQWIVSNITTPEKILSASGDVPTSVYNFATIQCHNYIKMKEHRDIDEVIPQAKDYEWEVFLEKFYKIVHNENAFKINERISAELMIEQSKYVLKKVKKYLPNLHSDGYKNMWLLKPNNGSRGCGIHVCRTLKYMMDTINNRKDVKYVVQKYLERPLLIHKTKFDIRQWFLVTCMPNVKVWLYKECYLRFSSQMFDLNKLHESIHLTNNSIQCRYKNNNQRSTNLPEQNMWDSETFKKYLAEIGQPYAWRNNIYKGMKECLVALFMLCQSKMELRINSFELCGADFMLSEDYHPYLIEINSRPALYPSTKITARMCPKVLEDVIKVTIDHARNPKASTGDFELIYTDSFNYSIPRNVNNLYIEGMSYFSKFLEKKPSIGLNNANIVQIPQQQQQQQQTQQQQTQQQPVKEVKNDSIKKILNIDPGVVKIDVRNTLEKILAVVHNDSNSKVKESHEERNKKFRSMLSEFVSIISNVKNVNEEV